MSELEIVIIISIVLLISLYVVVRNHNANNDKKIELKEKKNKEDIEKVAKAFYNSLKPKNYNDKQVLTKYNKGVYRDDKGRYASLND